MKHYELNGSWYTISELSDMSGIKAHTLRDRLRRGYSIEEAIKALPTDEGVLAFNEASWWEDWIGKPVDYVYDLYWNWCVARNYTPLSKQGFSRHIFKLYPMLKTVPTKQGNKCHRIIRLKN